MAKKAFYSIEEIFKDIEEKKIRAGLQSFAIRVKAKWLNRIRTEWYDRYTPKPLEEGGYYRYESYLESITLTKVKKSGNSYYIEIYSDDTIMDAHHPDTSINENSDLTGKQVREIIDIHGSIYSNKKGGRDGIMSMLHVKQFIEDEFRKEMIASIEGNLLFSGIKFVAPF